LKDLVEYKTVNIIGVIAKFNPIARSAHGRRGTCLMLLYPLFLLHGLPSSTSICPLSFYTMLYGRSRNIPKLNLDYYSSITICDSTRSLVGTGLLCFFYRDNTDDLPQPMSTGEILIAYNMKIRPHNLDIQAWSTHTTRFKLISPGFDRHTLRPDESSLVMQMREWWDARGGAPGAKGEVIKRDKDGAVANEEGVSLSRKLKTISGLEVNSFYDLVCEVRFPWNSSLVIHHLPPFPPEPWKRMSPLIQLQSPPFSHIIPSCIPILP
jgi:hypothetical protein